MASTAYSQPTISVNGPDTSFCFNGAQTRFLQKQPYKVKELQKTVKIYEQVVVYKDSTHYADSTIIAAQANTLSNNSLSSTLAAAQCTTDKATLKTEIRRQKKQKWLAVGVAAVILAVKVIADFQK